MTAAGYALVAASALAAVSVGTGAAVWQVQDWRYGRELERQARLQADTLNEIALAGATLQRTEQARRLALEQRLHASNQAHYSEMNDAQQTQKRLRDRLATSDLRLSVVLAATDSGDCSMRTAAAAGGVVHGARRTELDPAHAQRIIGITDDGDRGLIALRGCQDYVRAVRSQR